MIRKIRQILSLDQLLIGAALPRNTSRAVVATAIGLLTVAVDFWLVWSGHATSEIRIIAPSAAVLSYLWLASGDWRSVGLRLRPKPGWMFWIGASFACLIGVSIVAGSAVGYAYHQLQNGKAVPFYVCDPAYFWSSFYYMCVFAPVLEELVFRAAICTPLAPKIGPWPTVIISGAFFAAIHFVYGNPGPDNFLAGYFLAWAYLKSGSLSVPIFLHALGNLLVLFGQIIAWKVTS